MLILAFHIFPISDLQVVFCEIFAPRAPYQINVSVLPWKNNANWVESNLIEEI